VDACRPGWRSRVRGGLAGPGGRGGRPVPRVSGSPGSPQVSLDAGGQRRRRGGNRRNAALTRIWPARC